MKIRIRITTALLILSVSGLSSVSVGCSVLCSMSGVGNQACGCLTELRECGAPGDSACCDGLECEYDIETDSRRCVARRGDSRAPRFDPSPPGAGGDRHLTRY